MMNDDTIGGIIGNSIAFIFTAVQSDQIFQLISFILTSVSVVITIAFTCYKWWCKAKQDGKVTKDEIQELTDDIKDILTKKDEGEKDE